MADLTTLAAVKNYLGITLPAQDKVISSLISRESMVIQNWTGRVFPTVTRTSFWVNGSGSDRLMLPDAPIISVSALQIGTYVILPSPDGIQQGFTYDDTMIYLKPGAYTDSKFPRGYQNVKATWLAGYRTSETDFVPAGAAPTITPMAGGSAVSAVGVVYASTGNAMTQVGSLPLVGQFSFAAGAFSFNQSDYNAQVTMTYDYVPAAVEQACIEMVGLDLKQRDNLGVQSKSLAGETVSYTSKGMTDSSKEMLMPFRKVAPI